MTPTVCIEMVSFRGNPEFTIEQVQEVMTQTNSHIKEFDGFIKRTISVNEEGEFLDIVYWESLEQAKQAAADLQQNAEIMKHFKVIDFSTVTMKHFNSFSECSVNE